MPNDPKIRALVANLPEQYQPIFGYPNLSPNASRNCDDRLTGIVSVYTSLSKKAGRALNVLDLGCAQGYFSFRLAELGARVVGVDMLPANIDLCNALKDENASLDLSFERAKIEEYVFAIPELKFDLVLGLSVLHHLCAAHGSKYVRQILEVLRDRIGCGVFEFASHQEPADWAKHLPREELSFVSGFSFSRVLGYVPSHLAPINRPLVVASSRYWILDQYAGNIESSTTESHAYAQGTHQGSRLYIRGEGKIVKLFSLEGPRGEFNRRELGNEQQFLANPPAGFAPVPVLHAWKVGDRDAWLIRDELPGTLLTALPRESYDPMRIVRLVLGQLVALERAGFYHDDVRSWNTLILSDGRPTLIDYGAISEQPVDCGSQISPVYSFLSYLNAVASGSVPKNELLRYPFARVSNLRNVYGAWIDRLIAIPWNSWSYHAFEEALNVDSAPPKIKTASGEIDYLERFLDYLERQLERLIAVLEQAQERSIVREQLLRQMEGDLNDRTSQVATLTERLNHLDNRASELDSSLVTANTAAQREIRLKESELKQRVNDIQALQTLVSSLQGQLNELQSQLTAANEMAQTEVQNKERELVRAQRDANERMQQVETLTHLVRAHEAEQHELRRQIHELTNRIHVIEPESLARYEQIVILTERIQSVHSTLLNREAEIQHLKTALEGRR